MGWRLAPQPPGGDGRGVAGVDWPPGGVTPGVLGGGAGSVVEQSISAETQKETTLIGRLEQLELAMGPTRAQVRGYLYFQLSPKNTPKHLVLNYDGSAGRCKLPFK